MILNFYNRFWVNFHPVRRWEWSVIKRIVRGPRVLDAGCGTGGFSYKLAKMGFETFAFDYNADFVETAKKYNFHSKIKYDVMSIEKMTYPSAFFDSVICVSVIGQCDRDKALLELLRVTKPGGAIIITAMSWNVGKLQVPSGFETTRFFALKSSFARFIFNFFINFANWKSLLAFPLYWIFWLDSKLPGSGQSEVLVIKK